jgi:hypothetical protein
MFRLPLTTPQETEIYGIEYDSTIAAPEVTRVGKMSLHASLPVQSLMKRCLLMDDGTVNYYLDDADSTLKADGVTASILDGTDGQVMVEIPEHWRKFETEANVQRVLICLNPFVGAVQVKKMYVSAYKAALERTGSILSSVVNTTVDYRGGNNSATNDANSATLLGKPATAISRDNFRIYGQNRGRDWFDMDYQARKTICWLITIEFGTRNHQAALNVNLTTSGYKQGGLGTGPTDISSGDWSTFNGYYPLYNCGITNSLGNGTGEVPIVLQDFPTAGLTKNTQSNSYRGVENFFGDIWEWTNGVDVEVGAVDAQSFISDFLGKKFTANLAIANGYVSGIVFGSEGDILPGNTAGGSSTTYFSDYYYQNFASKGLRGLPFGGRANSGSSAGSFFAYAAYAPSYTYAFIGSRLCFFVR